MTSTYTARNVIKLFTLDEVSRPLITLSDTNKIRLSPTPAPGLIVLKADADGEYPVDDVDAYVTTWTTSPDAWTSWVAFEAVVTEKKDADDVVVTSYHYRLTDGVDVYYWTGAAWDLATTQWNTEQEINEGLSTWSSATLGVVVNPRTSDEDITPEVKSLKFLYGARIDYLRDLVLSFTDTLGDEARTWRQHTLVTASATATLNLTDDYPLDLDVEITDILAVYNHDDDPTHATNLLSGWAAPVITLASSIPENKSVWIDYEFKPRIAFATDVDYLELSAVPAIWIEDMITTTTRGFFRDHVLRRDTNVAYKWADTRVGDVEFMMSIEATNPDDHLRLTGQVEEMFAKVKQLRARGLDELFDITIENTYSTRGGPGVKGRLSSRYRVRVRNALLAASTVQRYGVQTLNLDLSMR
jgi:hypothetical protein